MNVQQIEPTSPTHSTCMKMISLLYAEFHTEGGGPGISLPPPENLKIHIVSNSCMTLWQCPTNYFPSPTKKSYMNPGMVTYL